MDRSKLLFALAATLAAACETPTAPRPRNIDAGARPAFDASSASQTTFSGEATVVQATVTPLGVATPITINLVETGELPESGGALNATLAKVDISKDQTAGILELGGKVGHASTVGQGKRSRSQATVADLRLEVNGTVIEATFLEALAAAVCDAAGNATASASSTVAGLTIGDEEYSVTTAPDQTIIDTDVLRVVANEQTPKPGGANDADITVNALHVTAYAIDPLTGKRVQVADVIVASAHADIHCGLCTDKGDDFTTGGGWFPPGAHSAVRKIFAVAGGYKNGQPWGHLNYLDKAGNVRVKGIEVTSYANAPANDGSGNVSVIEGVGELANGETVKYTVTVTDKGEPGNADDFRIVLSNGYTNGGVLGGGNIQFHDRPSRCPGN